MVKIFFISLLIFWVTCLEYLSWACLLIIELQGFFLYSKYKLLVRYILWNTFPPSQCIIFFTFFMVRFEIVKVYLIENNCFVSQSFLLIFFWGQTLGTCINMSTYLHSVHKELLDNPLVLSNIPSSLSGLIPLFFTGVPWNRC